MRRRNTEPQPSPQLWLVIGIAVCLIPTSAAGHTALRGIGSFWSGVAHLLTSLDHLAFLLGLAIWTSFYHPRFDARVIAAAFTAAFIGTLLGIAVGWGGGFDLVGPMAALLLIVGLAGASCLRVGAAPLFGVASAGGLIIGAAGAEATTGLSVGLFSLGDSIATACVLSYGLLAVRRLETGWGRVACRAGASWIAAIGLMVLALSVARHTGRV